MSSLVRNALCTFFAILLRWCGAVRVMTDVQKEMRRSGTDQGFTIDLALESAFTQGPPKEDCVLRTLDDKLDRGETALIKAALREQTQEVCKGGINQHYADYSIEHGSPLVVALQSTLSPRSAKQVWEKSSSFKICGFASLIVAPEGATVHVDLICSHMGYGGILLQWSEWYGANKGKPYADLEAVASARSFYESKGYRHCFNPCSRRCRDVLKMKDSLFIMKKCIAAQHVDIKPVRVRSTGNKVFQDITQFFVHGGSEDQKTFTSNEKTYRCCCRLKGLCNLVVEGRDKLPFIWQTGFQGCGLYVESSHSWNFWGEGSTCRIQQGSLNFNDHKALMTAWARGARQVQNEGGSGGSAENASVPEVNSTWTWTWW